MWEYMEEQETYFHICLFKLLFYLNMYFLLHICLFIVNFGRDVPPYLSLLLAKLINLKWQTIGLYFC